MGIGSPEPSTGQRLWAVPFLAIVAPVVLVGVRGIVGGLAFSGGLPDGSHGTEPAAAGERTPTVVESVLDGDTVEVTTRGGKTVRVRFLGISSPEIPHPGTSGECYGYRSSKHLKKLLRPGSDVMLVSDPSQASLDTYQRWLRYVQVDGRDVGRAQIRAGAAAARDSWDQASRYPAYMKVEGDARGRGTGMGRHAADYDAPSD